MGGPAAKLSQDKSLLPGPLATRTWTWPHALALFITPASVLLAVAESLERVIQVLRSLTESWKGRQEPEKSDSSQKKQDRLVTRQV